MSALRAISLDEQSSCFSSYELTADNVMKMLAIWMRFRCDIPVVIMGETGCGKTRLIQFMCDLLKTNQPQCKNLIKLKTHGGTTAKDIEDTVQHAIKQSQRNQNMGIHTTVLFFDEANTTDSIGVIKSVMCDGLLKGSPIPPDCGLKVKVVVYCNSVPHTLSSSLL